MVIQRYEELFSQARVEAIDAVIEIEDNLGIKNSDGGVFGIHLALDVLKVSEFKMTGLSFEG